MKKNDSDKSATPVFRSLVAPVSRVLSRWKSGVAQGIDAHHERATALRVYQGRRLDGNGAPNTEKQAARASGD